MAAVNRRRLWPLVILAAVILAGGALRLHRLGDLPYGFHPDEGYNALDALRILGGDRPFFLPKNNGREPLFAYGMAALFSVFGASITSARLASAIAGTLMIPAQFLLVRSLPLPRPTMTALISAAIVATNFWAVHQSHRALRSVALPLWIAVMLWAWWAAVRGRLPEDTPSPDTDHADEEDPTSSDGRLVGEPTPSRSRHLVFVGLTGLFLAAGVYTYLTARLLPAVLFGSALWSGWRARQPRLTVDALVAVAVAVALSLPLIRFFRAAPDMLLHRTNQISLLSADVNEGDLVGALTDSAVNLALAFNWQGPTWWYANLAGRPVFGLFIGAAMLLGLGLLARDAVGRRGRTPQHAAVLLALAFAVALLPAWLSTDAPRYVRLTATWPVLFLLPAWGLERITAALEPRLGRRVAWAALTLVVFVSATWSVRDMFWTYARAEQVYRGARVSTAEYGHLVAELVNEGPTYVSPTLWTQPVVRFLNAGDPPASFDMRHGLILPREGAPRYVFDPIEVNDEAAFGARWPALERQVVDASTFGGRGGSRVIVYRAPDAGWPAVAAGSDGPAVAFGDNIRLEAAELSPSEVRPGDVITATLVWRSIAPTDLDHNFFVHLLAEDGQAVAQFDGPPLDGSHPTHLWRPGERVVQQVTLRVPLGAPPGEMALLTGWYDWRDGVRLPIAGDDDDAAVVARTKVRIREGSAANH